MKKILFLINSLGAGGAEKVLTDIVNNLNYEKYDITVMTIYDKGIYKKHLNSQIKYKSIIKFKNKFLQRVSGYIFRNLTPPRLRYKLFIRKKYDVEIAFLEGLPVKVLSHSTNKEALKLTWVHTNLQTNYNLEKIFKTIETNRDAYLKFDKIICVSNDSKEGFIQRFNINNNLIVQYNLIDEIKINEKSQECVSYEFSKNFNLITVGSLFKVKGFDNLITACRRLYIEGLNFQLIILGEGPERGNLESLIAEFNLEKHVKLLGYKNNPYKYISKSDLFVSSSRAEGYSLVVAEALVLQTPILSTKGTSASDILLNGEYGMMVENSIEGLYEGMAKIIKNKQIYKELQNKSKEGSRYFNKNRTIEEIESLIDER